MVPVGTQVCWGAVVLPKLPGPETGAGLEVEQPEVTEAEPLELKAVQALPARRVLDLI